jgi:chromosome segregation ATPase
MLKNWLTSCAIAFGVGCACVLPFNRSLAQSMLIGLATIPGAIACSSIRLRQRDRHISRQLASETSRLHRLRQQSEQSNLQLQNTLRERQSIEARVRQLNNLVANLTDRIERDTQSQYQLERDLVSTATYREEGEEKLAKLNSKISDKQAILLDLTAQLGDIRQQLTQSQLTNHQAELANLETQLQAKITAVNEIDLDGLRAQLEALKSERDANQTQLADLSAQLLAKTTEIASSDRSLQSMRSEISSRQSELANLVAQHQAKIAEIDRLDLVGLRSELAKLELEYNVKQSQLVLLESELLTKTTAIESSDRTLQLTQSEISDRQAELATLTAQIQAQVETASQIDIVALRSQLNSIELQSREKQARLVELEAQLVSKNTEIITVQNNVEFTQLELQDRRTELADLEDKIYAKLEEMDDVDRDLKIAMQHLKPQPPQTSRKIDKVMKPGEWQQNFIDNPHLEILQHIEKHGAIAESEVNHKLGNPRSVRQFANKLEEYTQHLPFTIRVESSPQGNRYLKDSYN